MRKFTIILLVLILVLAIPMVSFASDGRKTALPSTTTFVMNGRQVTFDSAYNIDGNNYIQLRSVAQMLSGTASQFNVYWDEELREAVIEPGMPYTGVKPVDIWADVYGIGDTVYMGNTQVTILDVVTMDELEFDGTGIFPGDGNLFYAVTFSVLTTNTPPSGAWFPFYFIRHLLGTSGTQYSSYSEYGDGSMIYTGQPSTITIYFKVPEWDRIASITVNDGLGKEKTVLVY